MTCYGVCLSTLVTDPTTTGMVSVGLNKEHPSVANSPELITNQYLYQDRLDHHQVVQELRESERAMRALYHVTSARKLTFAQRLQGLLNIGRQRFRLDVGCLASIEGDRFEVIAASSSRHAGLTLNPGDVLDLAQTYCRETFGSKGPIAIESAGTSKQWCHHPTYLNFGLQAYIGTPVIVADQRYGVLSFLDINPRLKPFSAGEKEFLRLMAQWIGGEIERKQVQDELNRQVLHSKVISEKFRNLVEQTNDWVWEVDTQAIFTYVSPKVEEIIGYRPDQVMGRSTLEFMEEDEAKRFSVLLSYFVSRQEPFTNLEKTLIHQNGQPIVLETSGAPILNEQGDLQGYRGIARDITQRKQAEHEIRKAFSQEKELNELRSRFVSMTSHEFRTPLTTIMMSVEILEHLPHSQDERRTLYQQIQSSIRHMVRLLDDVLLIGQAEVGKLTCYPRWFNLGQLCQDIISELEVNCVGGQPKLISQIACGRVYLDENLLRHILVNLLSNAIKYSSPDGCIEVKCRCELDTVTLQVQDKGIGIPQDDQKRLFDCFYRAKNVGTVSGTGLGLAIVKQCVDLLQGTILVESEVGQGSTFTVTLPLELGPTE
jgi:PAS domain S-box-containing protein